MSGRKRSHCFAITFNHVEWTKDCFGEFLRADNLVKRLAIGEEVHHGPLDPLTGQPDDTNHGIHHHVFVEFEDKYFLTEVHDVVQLFLGQEDERISSFDVQVWVSKLYLGNIYISLIHILVLQISKVLDTVPLQRRQKSILIQRPGLRIILVLQSVAPRPYCVPLHTPRMQAGSNHR